MAGQQGRKRRWLDIRVGLVGGAGRMSHVMYVLTEIQRSPRWKQNVYSAVVRASAERQRSYLYPSIRQNYLSFPLLFPLSTSTAQLKMSEDAVMPTAAESKPELGPLPVVEGKTEEQVDALLKKASKQSGSATQYIELL